MTSINNRNQFDTNFFDETYTVFYLETEGLLAEAELLLMNVEVDNPNMNDLNTIAYILRLIKEITVMFYSIDLSENEMSTTLSESEHWIEKICKNETKITVEYINQLLAAMTLLKNQVMKHNTLSSVTQKQNAGVEGMHETTRMVKVNGALNGY